MASSTSACTDAISSSRLGTVSSKLLGSLSGMNSSNMRLFRKSIQHANLGQMIQRLPDRVEVRPASRIAGDVVMPGDKSISHRFAMIGSLARGETTIHNFASTADTHSTLACLAKLGVRFHENGTDASVQG